MLYSDVCRIDVAGEASAEGMDWINAETGSATASVMGGMPPVFRNFAAAAFLFILRCLLPMMTYWETFGTLDRLSSSKTGPPDNSDNW